MNSDPDLSIEPAPLNAEHPNLPLTDDDPAQDERTLDFPIVGIGASAGGLAAFEQLFSALPPNPDMAFVVVQHLSPPHKSILPEIIQRYTSMTVSQVTDGMEIKPDSVYVIPPGTDLALRNGHLKLLTPEAERGFRLPIDFFFRSLAKDLGPRAIGIVLSGTGSDGSLGLKTIKAEGGLTIAQEPGTAEYADMPRNAIATKDVDFILPPEKMGELIRKFVHHQILEGYHRGESEFQIPVGGVQKLYYLLRSKTGHDFSLYKQSTLLRRIERRMKICLSKNLEEYLEFLQNHPEEIDALFKEMLINVTHFFRDPEAFQTLIEKAIRPLLSMKLVANTPIRIWVAGCSSGEEAYSVAIAVQEQIEALKADCKVQIYATDLDAEAISSARKGFYSDGSLENVSIERLQRYFHQEEEGYQIKKNIRDLVVFSTQNLVSDPPFSKIDLLCCRNVLIYLEHELQNQLFLQFHYSLNPDGILFLGTSESIGENRDLFATIDRKHKLFRRIETATQQSVKTRAKPVPQKFIIPERGSRADRPVSGALRALVEKLVLEYYTPACVLIDQKHDVLFIHGRTGKYLEPVPGETNANLVRMAREGLKTELVAAIYAAITHKETARREAIQVKTNGDYQSINLTVRPVGAVAEYGDLILVVFEEAPAPGTEAVAKPTTGQPRNRRVAQLEKELREKDEYLQTIIDELEDNNQDLKSANEELQSTNEEMQSTNEELETSKEELQSINEELSTINAELHNKNEELSAVNNDIYNLLASTEIGTIFLDLDLHIRRFTPAIQRIYNFLPTDAGRPIAHFVSNLEYEHLIEDVQQVLKTLVPKAIEVQTKDGAWYLINMRPYRTLENVIAGAVITFVNITEQKRGDVLRRLGTILRDANDAITMQDFNGKILAWNRGAIQLYGWTEAEALKLSVQSLIPEDKREKILAMYQQLARGEVIAPFETQRVARDGRIVDIWLTMTILVNDADQPVGVATTERDITERKRAEQGLVFENRASRALNHWYQSMLEHGEEEFRGEDACRALVSGAGYRAAWFGRVENNQIETIKPDCWAGLGDEEMRALAKDCQAAVKEALASRQPVAVGDIVPLSAKPGWRTDVSQHNLGAFLVLPVIDGEAVLGALVIYAAEPGSFLEAEMALLSMFSRRMADMLGSAGKQVGKRGVRR